MIIIIISELFSKEGLRGFPDEMKISDALNFEILGVPIGEPIFCAKSIAEKRAHASRFLALLKEVGSVDSQVALMLLRQCGGFCRMVHIARCTPPSVALEGLHLFDEEVRQTFSDSMCIDPSDSVWQLSLSRGGLRLRSASLHSSAAFMSSFSMSGFATNTSHHLLRSLDHFNACVSPAEAISIDELLNSPTTQKMLSTKIENKQFQLLFDASSIPNRARLMSASSNLAASWLSVIPSPGLNLHLDTAEFQTALKWWLGIDMFGGSRCPSCSTQSLDSLGHHALTRRYNGDVVSHHNQLRNTFFESCRQAGVGGQMEVGSGLGHDEWRTWPADVLVPNWDLGKPAAFDLTVASPLNQSILNEACVTAGSSARVSEQRKHASNDVKCSELGCIRWQLGLDTFNGSMCPFCPVPLHLVTLQLSASMGETSSYATSIYAMWSPILAAMLILVNVPWSLKMSGVGVDLCSPNSGNL